ncbi:uncharacterized protein MONBRDRAFT_22130 [Monosiga brevicollis MX1]|uniref:Elongator complex protein 6 n=1 Tax=Monosiga brevicollis TaxID=81824 RepID=A9UPN2_MONBE|nr:uncharacterized protein MONBRDRAFT_22130 [Monosiga brevicollis MX1]EDQ92452.1 predicted protein [Monosiga brevicollis MX1]|eukprot:XP_001742214.1 hypothetical protein [Monosiga brevicollis MX1]
MAATMLNALLQQPESAWQLPSGVLSALADDRAAGDALAASVTARYLKAQGTVLLADLRQPSTFYQTVLRRMGVVQSRLEAQLHQFPVTNTDLTQWFTQLEARAAELASQDSPLLIILSNLDVLALLIPSAHLGAGLIRFQALARQHPQITLLTTACVAVVDEGLEHEHDVAQLLKTLSASADRRIEFARLTGGETPDVKGSARVFNEPHEWTDALYNVTDAGISFRPFGLVAGHV